MYEKKKILIKKYNLRRKQNKATAHPFVCLFNLLFLFIYGEMDGFVSI